MRQRRGLPFALEEYRRRLGELRGRMEAARLDLVLVTTPENITYLTGFESPGHYWFQCLAVPLEGEPVAVSRLLEVSGMEALSWVEHNEPYGDGDDPMEVLARCLRSLGWARGRIGVERDCWFFTARQQERFFSLCAGPDFVDASGLVEQGRLVKSEAEIDLMRAAARTAEAGMAAGIAAVAEGATENDVAAEIHYAMIKAGSEWPSIVPFVASGERGAIGHATWAGRRIGAGDSVFIEIGGCLRRYHAALLRTCVVGEPDEVTRQGAEVVQGAYAAAVAAIRPGVPAGEVDGAARRYIRESGFAGTQVSRSAYSIGIAVPPDWGEGHILSMLPGEERPLQENMTFHLLPFVQVPGRGGIGCSETIRVTADGCERITDFERGLFVR